MERLPSKAVYSVIVPVRPPVSTTSGGNTTRGERREGVLDIFFIYWLVEPSFILYVRIDPNGPPV